MKTKSVLHNLSPADQTFVIDLCSKHTYARVVEIHRTLRDQNAQRDPEIIPSQLSFHDFPPKNPGNSALSTHFRSMNTHQKSMPSL